MDTLDSLFNKYGSDKGTLVGVRHSYAAFYEKYLAPMRNNENVLILEIGVSSASLKTWAEYCPNSTVVGLDVRTHRDLRNDRISTHVLDQSDPKQLEQFASECKNKERVFDMIIDDGSHHMRDQQITLGQFFPILRSGGVYFLEDLHTSLADDGHLLYGARLDIQENRKNTTLFYLMESLSSAYCTPEQNKYLQDNIDTIEIHNQFNQHQESWCKFRSITSAVLKR